MSGSEPVACAPGSDRSDRWSDRCTPLVTAFSIVLLLAGSAVAQTGGTFDLAWNTIDGGAGTSSGGAFVLRGTIGQPDAGTMNGDTFTLNCGFHAGGAVSNAACPGEGDCCTANVTPGCTFSNCCESVCALDSFCCETQWDADCANAARAEPACGCGSCPYGDNAPLFGVVGFDDVLCAVNGFANETDCPTGDIFGTIASPCAPNGKINFDDVLAVLNAFRGNPPCPCG